MAEFDKYENLIQVIKNTDEEDLQLIADTLRSDLIESVSKSGGHLASNLGIVELTVALHRVFDSPKDKIIFDVGHQCYIHKMITGRREFMKDIRSFGGLSGFPKRAESVHDMYDSGHSGTSISAALGYAKARDLKAEDYSCVAIIGDGALTGGVAFEALNHAGTTNTPLIVLLNDNQWSIGPGVGGTTKHLSRLRTSDVYIKFKASIKKSNNQGFVNALRRLRDSIKYLFEPDQIFEELGFKYYGPIDGHDISEMIYAFEFAKKLKRPVLIHVITQKGKGFEPAEKNPSKFHGIGPFDIDKVTAEPDPPGNSWSEVFGDEIRKQANTDDRIVAISAAMIDATGLGPMQKEMPDRVFDVGIAEQHAVSFAAGLALNGMKPVVAIYSTFLQRAYDQIVTEVCLQNLPVIFAIDRAGVTGADGETHQGIFDISYLNSMPNMVILSASDEESFRGCIDYALTLDCPCSIRYGKGNAPKSGKVYSNYKPGLIYRKEGFETLIITDGAFAASAAIAASQIKSSVCVANLEVLAPLNKEYICRLISKYKKVITIEDGTCIGGFGSEISRIAAENASLPQVLNLGWPDIFIEHGSIDQLRAKYGLDVAGIKRKVEAFIEDKA